MLPKLSSSRRRFLQNAALFSAGLLSPLARSPYARASDEFVDAIVIGSGFGGAVASLRLAESGITTLILERGRRWPITLTEDTFATFRNPDRRAAWLRTTSPVLGFGFGQDDVSLPLYTGVFERIDSTPSVLERISANGVVVINGAGVGGGSLVYNAISYQPTRENFQRVFPSQIDYNEMEQVYYPRVRAIIKPGPTPPDILNTEFYQGTRVLLEQGRASGLPTRLLDLDVDWEIVRQEINGTKQPAAIIGETWYGINSGAKSSLDRNYLALAEQTGRVTIAPLHSVTSIAENPGGGYRVFCNQIDEGGQVVMSKSFTCRLLFLAAGSLGTSALLVRAKGQGTLPNLNNFTGQGWAGNGDHLGLLFNLPPTSVNPPGGQGGPSGAVIQNFTNPFNPVSLMNLAQWNADSSLLGLGIGIPVNRGGFSYDPSTDSVVLNWPNSANAEYVKSMYKTLEVLNEGNTSSTRNPFSVVLTNTTAHPLGGAVMGQTCDLDGRVMGYRGLYVVDGALIPGSAAACNPSLTIAAIAERCMDRIRPELAVVNR